MNSKFLPDNIRNSLERKLQLFEDLHGSTIQQVAVSLASKSDSAWDQLCDYVILRYSLGKILGDGERLVIAARGLLLNHQSGGIEAFIESEECNYWKCLLDFLTISDTEAGNHFGQLMTLTGKEFSEERELRLNELQSYLTDSTGGTLAALEDSYNRSPYPDPSSIITFLKSEEKG